MKAQGLTAKQEKFCQSVASGMSQADAYRSAYDAGKMKPATIQETASRLMSNPKVSARVAAIRKPVVEKVQYDLEQAMREAQEAYNISKGKEQGGAMVAAVQLRAKLNGLLIDRAEIKHTSVLEDLAHDERKTLQEKIDEAIGRRSGQPAIADPSSALH